MVAPACVEEDSTVGGELWVRHVRNVQLDPDGIRAHDALEQTTFLGGFAVGEAHDLPMQFRGQPIEQLLVQI